MFFLSLRPYLSCIRILYRIQRNTFFHIFFFDFNIHSQDIRWKATGMEKKEKKKKKNDLVEKLLTRMKIINRRASGNFYLWRVNKRKMSFLRALVCMKVIVEQPETSSDSESEPKAEIPDPEPCPTLHSLYNRVLTSRQLFVSLHFGDTFRQFAVDEFARTIKL